MKPLQVAIATIIFACIVHAEINSELIDKLKKAYNQSLDDVIKELTVQQPNDQSIQHTAQSTIPRSTQVITQPVNVLHKRIVKSNRGIKSENSSYSNQRKAVLNTANANTPKVNVSGFIKTVQRVTGPNGVTRIQESTQKIGDGDINNLQRKLPGLESLLGEDTNQHQFGFPLAGLLNLPFTRDIDEEKPVVVIRHISEPESNPLDGLLNGLLNQDNVVNTRPQQVVRHRRKRIVRRKKRTTVRHRKVQRRRPVVQVKEDLHPEVEHVANLFGDFLDNEIARHGQHFEPEHEDDYHHKVLRPKLVTVRERSNPSPAMQIPQLSIFGEQNDEPNIMSLTGSSNSDNNALNPLDIISKALEGITHQEPERESNPFLDSILPTQENPVHIKIAIPQEEYNQGLGGLFGSLIAHLAGNDVDDEVPKPVVTHHRVSHRIHHKKTVHKIQHAPSLGLFTQSPVQQESPLDELINTLEGKLGNRNEPPTPSIVIRKVRTPLLNENYGDPVFIRSSSFPQIGHGRFRKEFKPLDLGTILGANLPDQRNHRRQPGHIVHKRRNNRRQVNRGVGATLTAQDLQEIMNGILPNIVRRKRNLRR